MNSVLKASLLSFAWAVDFEGPFFETDSNGDVSTAGYLTKSIADDHKISLSIMQEFQYLHGIIGEKFYWAAVMTCLPSEQDLCTILQRYSD